MISIPDRLPRESIACAYEEILFSSVEHHLHPLAYLRFIHIQGNTLPESASTHRDETVSHPEAHHLCSVSMNRFPFMTIGKKHPYVRNAPLEQTLSVVRNHLPSLPETLWLTLCGYECLELQNAYGQAVHTFLAEVMLTTHLLKHVVTDVLKRDVHILADIIAFTHHTQQNPRENGRITVMQADPPTPLMSEDVPPVPAMPHDAGKSSPYRWDPARLVAVPSPVLHQMSGFFFNLFHRTGPMNGPY